MVRLRHIWQNSWDAKKGMVMEKVSRVTMGLLLVMGSLFFVLQSTGSEVLAGGKDKILEFDTMIGVPRPFTGSGHAIRGVNGGGLPWVIYKAKGELKVNGDIEIDVEGLVFDPDDPVVIERGLAGINTVPNFKAIVSCLSINGSGEAVTVNVETGLFPADAQGNAEIEDTVNLPDPCIAPIIFVTSPGGAWFAATGF